MLCVIMNDAVSYPYGYVYCNARVVTVVLLLLVESWPTI